MIGVIPARGGSKGIPGKNLKVLAGNPLVAWSILAAQHAKCSFYPDEIYVSTEDVEIAKVAIQYGASVIKRPDELATDDATTLEVLQHTISVIDCDVIVLLQPTSPVRFIPGSDCQVGRNNIIDTCVRRFFAMKPDTLATGYMSAHRAWTNEHAPRQKIEPYFHDDGCVYIFKREVIESGRWIGDKPFQIINEPAYSLEIDTLADFWAVEGIMNHVSEMVR